MAYSTQIQRRPTREVVVGGLGMGGEHPIRVQSMTNTNSWDVGATVAQIQKLTDAGCEVVRITVPKPRDVEALPAIRERISIPLVCDIHFDYRMALGCLEARTADGRPACDKVRINPGNIGGEERFRQVVCAARDRGIPMRLGVNAGSLEKDLLNKYGFPTPQAMVESALRHIETAESLGYQQLVVSLKSSHVPSAVESYRLFSEQCDYPTHLGITEAGAVPYGVTKSAVGLGAILLQGVGDTIRVSLLTERKEDEIDAAFDILQATGRRIRRPEIIACPTCGRLEIDLQKIVSEVKVRLDEEQLPPLTISILGCIVNGIGEAREADLGIAAGRGKGVIFRRGEIVRHVDESDMVDALLHEARNWDAHVDPSRKSSSELAHSC
jgi:(E)-4-hydroxy-3-methylbut-2-enyl-diphosphate synthase